MRNDISEASTVADPAETEKRRRGRPRKNGALSGAQRQARFRKSRQPVDLGVRMTATVADLAAEFDLTQSDVVRRLVRFALCNRNWRQTGF